MITMKEICISQGSAVTFFRCGGQIHNHVCLISAGFFVPKLTKLGCSFLTLFKKHDTVAVHVVVGPVLFHGGVLDLQGGAGRSGVLVVGPVLFRLQGGAGRSGVLVVGPVVLEGLVCWW